MHRAPRRPVRSSWRSSAWAAALALLVAQAARADGEVRGRVTGDRNSPGVVYAADLPEAMAPPKTHATLQQLHLRFIPRVLPIQQGTAVDFVNEDATAHNIFSPSAPDAFDLGTFGSGTRSLVFKEPGARVILCNIHLEMVAWILVLKTSWFASVDEQGGFSLKLPPGHHKLVLWRPREPERSQEIDVPASGAVELRWDLNVRAP